MPDRRITELPELVAVLPTDVLPLVRDPAGAPATSRATVAALLSLAWPVGSIYFGTSSENPATTLGFGTWAAFGAGRVPVGLDATQAEFDALEETGGAKDVTLTAAQSGVPAHGHAVTDPGHTHVQGVNSTATGGLSGYTADTSTNTRVNSGYSTSSATTGVTVTDATPAGAAQAHTNLPPYVVVAMWKRVA
jgi:microcystin-dependent protein